MSLASMILFMSRESPFSDVLRSSSNSSRLRQYVLVLEALRPALAIKLHGLFDALPRALDSIRFHSLDTPIQSLHDGKNTARTRVLRTWVLEECEFDVQVTLRLFTIDSIAFLDFPVLRVYRESRHEHGSLGSGVPSRRSPGRSTVQAVGNGRVRVGHDCSEEERRDRGKSSSQKDEAPKATICRGLVECGSHRTRRQSRHSALSHICDAFLAFHSRFIKFCEVAENPKHFL